MIHCCVLMQLGKTRLLSSQSQWWITFTNLIRHVESHFVAWQVWQNRFKKYCTPQCMHVKIAWSLSCMQDGKNEGKISVMLGWSCKEVCFQEQLTWHSRTTCEWQDLFFWLFYIRNDLRKSSMLYGGDFSSIWRKQTSRDRREIFIISPHPHSHSAGTDEKSFLSEFSVKFTFNFILMLSFPALQLSFLVFFFYLHCAH